jgi:hypothetical protein
MKNKKYILVFLLVLIVGFSFYYYFNLQSKNNSQSNPMLAVPERTAAFIVCEDVHSLSIKIDSLEYLNQLQESLIFTDFRAQLSFLDSFYNKYNTSVSFNKVIFSLNNSGSSKLGFLAILELNQFISLKQFKKLLKSEFHNVQEYKYQEEKIFSAELEGQKLSFSIYNNLLLYSVHAPLIEESLNNLKKDNQKTISPEFKKLDMASQENDLNIFVDYNSIHDLKAIVFNAAFINSKQNTLKNVDWSKTSISLNEKNIDFKNTYSYEFGDKSDIDYIAKPNTVDFSLDNFLPNNTAYFKAIKSKNNRIFQSNNLSYKYFSPWLDEEIAFFSIETFDEDYLKRSGLVLKAKDIDTAKVNLYLLNKEMKPVESFEGMAIYVMNVAVVSKIFKSNLFYFEKPYFSFIGKYVVFANDITVLRTCHQKVKSNKFLKADLVFQGFIKNYNTSANSISFLNPQRWNATINFIFNKNMMVSNFGKTKLETFVSDSSVFSIGKISFDKENIQKTAKIWELNLDTVSNFKPQIVINADNKRKEIITQDEKNNIYLVNQSGEVLFKKKIEEQIIGDIFQIDYFKSRKLQYVFNTSNHIYVIDRNGKIVSGFPLKLPAESSNSMLVVNYDKAKIYRYFVACKNGKIYGYEANGKPLDSWSPLAGNYGLVNNKLKHSSFNGKDYLYFNDEGGTFYVANRKGEQRFEPINFDSKFSGSFYKTNKGFINLGEGSIYKVDLNGKTVAKIVGDKDYVHFANYSEKEAFAIANKNEFRVAKSKWTLLGKRGINDEIVSITKEKIQNKVWFFVQGKKSVYLINDLGEIHPDFPMLSNSAARIEKFINTKNEILLLNEGIKLKAFELVVPE